MFDRLPLYPSDRLRRAAAAFLLLALLAVAGCDSSDPVDDNDDPPPPTVPTLTGSYLGTTTVQGATFTIDMQIVENGGSVNGNGTLVFIDPVAVSASGTYNFPNVSMTIRSSGLQDLNFSGTLSADGQSITGTMRGSGFDNFGITLRRQ